jgi:glycosyltransferase involved in cell wall biosynthesis
MPPAPPEPVDVSVVIPCRNEAATIAACVRAVFAAFAEHGYHGEVLVVDNGSTDASAAEAQTAGATVLAQPIRGYGAACIAGLHAARGRVLVLLDGDGTYDPALLPRFVEPLHAGYAMVLGTRRNGEIARGAMQRRHRHVLEPLQTALTRRFLPFHVSDVRCGMRSVTREAWSAMDVQATGMDFSTEMLLAAARQQLEVVEVPVTFAPRPQAAARRTVADGWRVIRQLLLLSPTRLFLVPGALMTLLGLGMELALLPGPLRVGAFTFDFHFMFVGGALALLGLQVLLLGLYAKTWTLVHEPALADDWIRGFHARYSLERALAVGLLLVLVGLAVNVGIVWQWLDGAGGTLFAVRPAMLALTLMLAGGEILFAAFFLSLLRAGHYARA